MVGLHAAGAVGASTDPRVLKLLLGKLRLVEAARAARTGTGLAATHASMAREAVAGALERLLASSSDKA